MQRPELLVPLLLMQQPQPQPPVVVVHGAELGAAVVSLRSGLLALIGEAVARVESELETRAALLDVPHCCTMHSCARLGYNALL
jgi:hypothetical protein